MESRQESPSLFSPLTKREGTHSVTVHVNKPVKKPYSKIFRDLKSEEEESHGLHFMML